jgi:hypothetical protein
MLFGYLPPLMRERTSGLQPADAKTPELPVANRQHVDTHDPKFISWLMIALICVAARRVVLQASGVR